jgi:hypothetical protein
VRRNPGNGSVGPACSGITPYTAAQFRTTQKKSVAARRNPGNGSVGPARGRNDNTDAYAGAFFCAVTARSDSTLFHAVPARNGTTFAGSPATTACRVCHRASAAVFSGNRSRKADTSSLSGLAENPHCCER